MREHERVPARTLVLILAAAALTAGCGDDKGGKRARHPAAPPGPPLATGSFVGTASATKEGLVGVVVAPAATGAGRQVQAYLCSPADRVFEWFAGAATGGRIALKSEDGSTLQATVSRAGARGTIALRTGRKVVFTTHPATGIEGLYEVIVSRDGPLDGAAATGAQVQGKVGGGTGTENFTAPDGRTTSVSGPNMFVPGAARSAEVVFVIAGRTRVGGGKLRGTKFVDASATF